MPEVAIGGLAAMLTVGWAIAGATSAEQVERTSTPDFGCGRRRS